MRASFAINLSGETGNEAGLERMDARAKMTVSLLASVATVALSALEAQLVLFGMSMVYALGMRRFRVLLLAYGIVILMFLIAAACSWGISRAAPAMRFDAEGLLIPFLRVASMVNVVLPLALTSRLQSLLTSLKGLRLPFCIYIPAAVMLRFIPTFINDIKQVGETLKIRGYRMTMGGVLRHPVMMLRLLFTPLLFRSLRTSEELGVAAELKGLESGCTLSPYRRPEWKFADTALVVAALAVVAIAAACQHVSGVPFFGGRMY